MIAAANLVEVAALVGDTARATILAALMGGERSTGANSLTRASRGRLPVVISPWSRQAPGGQPKRRFGYYRIASPLVATMLESIKAVAAIEPPPRHRPRSAQDEAMRLARTCYDHLAGSSALPSLTAWCQAILVLTDDGGEVTSRRASSRLRRRSRPAGQAADLLPPCLDWSERRYHLAGPSVLRSARRCLELGWLERSATAAPFA